MRLATRAATAGWMASPVKAGYVFRKEEMARSKSARVASTAAERTSPKIRGKGEKLRFFFFFACVDSRPHLFQEELTPAQRQRFLAVPKHSTNRKQQTPNTQASRKPPRSDGVGVGTAQSAATRARTLGEAPRRLSSHSAPRAHATDVPASRHGSIVYLRVFTSKRKNAVPSRALGRTLNEGEGASPARSNFHLFISI